MKFVIAVAIGEIVIHNLPKEDGIFCYLQKEVEYKPYWKSLDLCWEWVERKKGDCL